MPQLLTVIILITTSIALAQVSNHHDIRTSPIQQTQAPDLTHQELHDIKASKNFKHLECLQDLSIKDKSTCPKPSNKF